VRLRREGDKVQVLGLYWIVGNGVTADRQDSGRRPVVWADSGEKSEMGILKMRVRLVIWSFDKFVFTSQSAEYACAPLQVV
jgi:hypothetical protein